MWKTIKVIKKMILLQLNNVKNKSIYLPDLTFGLKWSKINFMIGDCRLSTSENENKHTLNGSSSSQSINIETYNTKYRTRNIDIGFSNGQELTMHTNSTYFYITSHFSWEGSGILSDAYIGFGLDVYGLTENGVKVFLKNIYIDNALWSLSSVAQYDDCYDPDKPCTYYTLGDKSLMVLIQIDIHPKYKGFALKVVGKSEERYISYRYNPLNFHYIDTSQELERTATDIHLIAWEES